MEIRAYPSAYGAWESLVLLLAAQGRAADVRKTVKELTETVPGAESYLSAARVLAVVGEPALAGAVRREGAARHPGDERLRPGAVPRG
jgi:hypothetical protein